MMQYTVIRNTEDTEGLQKGSVGEAAVGASGVRGFVPGADYSEGAGSTE